MTAFTSPEHFPEKPFYNFKRMPRKLKKRIKKTLEATGSFLNINQKLWYLLEFENKAYRDFLISKIALD